MLTLVAATGPSSLHHSGQILLCIRFDGYPSGSVRLFQHTNYGGLQWTTNATKGHLGDFNDRASSVVNNSDRAVDLHDDADFKGDYLRVAPHTSLPDLTRACSGIDPSFA